MKDKTYWNHRVFKKYCSGDGWYYTIREAYYTNDKITGFTDGSRGVGGGNIKELREVLQWMGKCLDKPVVILNEIDEIVGEE
jgi:hypothetical protein